MILKGSQRGGSRQLAAHLLNDMDNDHVTLHELRGFVADDLHGALAEAHAISKATQCKQFLFSLSLNPPKAAACDLDTLMSAVDRAEKTLGLGEQPRAIVVHEKEGRRHAHVVWSRIDPNDMKAVQLSFFKRKLNGLAKELYLEHGWELPDGLKENGWKNPLNFTLAEWQQAKRLQLDPREVKQIFQTAWRQSDGLRAFQGALGHHGYFLAAGDRRNFVAVDVNGEVFSVSRVVGVKTKVLSEKLGTHEVLPSVDKVKSLVRRGITESLRQSLREFKHKQRDSLRPLEAEREKLVLKQREERKKLEAGLEKRRQEEAKMRAARISYGVRGVWEIITGKAAAIRRENERSAYESFQRDRQLRESMYECHANERHDSASRIEIARKLQQKELMQVTRQVSLMLREDQNRARERGHALELG